MGATAVASEAPEAYAGVRTTPALWRSGAAAFAGRTAFLAEKAGGRPAVSWEEAAERVDALARGLLARGVGHDDKVAIFAATRLEWTLLDWAIMSIGAVVVGLYPSTAAAECAYVLGHSESRLVFVGDEEQRAKIESVRRELPDLQDVVPIAELDRLEQEGRANGDAMLPEVAEDDLGTFIYTSGTTGSPKGVMLTHRNLVAAATISDRPLIGADDVVLLFLPLAHCYARLVSQGAAFHGYTLAFCADPNGVAEALLEVRPTVLPAVPRVYEKVHATVLGQIERSGGAKRAIGRWALRVGAEVSRTRRAGRRLPLRLRLAQRLADRLVFAKARAKLGGRVRFGVSGAAPLSRDVLELFHALGVLVIEGYGLTETEGSATVNHPDEFRFGTVGQPVGTCEIAIADDGEILLRSDSVFAGYYKDPEATAAALTSDGWFRTGDVGELDGDGFLTITDRKKDLIITAGGKNVAPQNIENALKSSRFVSQAIIVGDRRPFLTALVTLDESETAASGRDPHELVQELVDEVNRERTRYEQIKRFAILPRELSAAEGEITPTLKLRRSVVLAHFADVVDALYE